MGQVDGLIAALLNVP